LKQIKEILIFMWWCAAIQVLCADWWKGDSVISGGVDSKLCISSGISVQWGESCDYYLFICHPVINFSLNFYSPNPPVESVSSPFLCLQSVWKLVHFFKLSSTAVLQFVYASDWMFLSHYKLENMSFLKGLSYGSHKRMDYSKRNIFILALSVTDSWGGSSMAPYDYFSSEGADRSLKPILFKALWRVCAVGALLSSTMASRCNLTRFLFSRCFSRIKSWLLTGKKKG
jgi:hypothetical protein